MVSLLGGYGLFLLLFRAKAIDTSYRHHACMNGCMGGDFFGEKPHQDEALAKSRWGLNSYFEIGESENEYRTADRI